jgi:hypothetical protein
MMISDESLLEETSNSRNIPMKAPQSSISCAERAESSGIVTTFAKAGGGRIVEGLLCVRAPFKK